MISEKTLTLRDLVRYLGPKWLTRDRDVGPLKEETDSRFLFASALYMDATIARVEAAVKQRFPGGGAAEDALPYVARARQIIRGLSESREAWEKRLQRAWDDWQLAGHPYALLEQIRAYLTPYAVDIGTVDVHSTWFLIDPSGTRSKVRSSAWNWDGDAVNWGRFWVVIHMPDGVPFARGPAWGTGKWGDANRTWGSTATSEEIASLRSIVRAWKPAGTSCPFIVVVLEETSGAFDPSSTAPPAPDGTWGHWSKNSGGVQVPSRDPDAIYIDG